MARLKLVGDQQAEKPKSKKEPTPADVALGERIRARRVYLHMTQGQVAYRMGRTDGGIGHWEAGTARINAVDLVELARVLDCSANYLLGEDQTTPAPASHDSDWLGHLGRMMQMVPPGRFRDFYKERLREDAERESAFLRRLAECE